MDKTELVIQIIKDLKEDTNNQLEKLNSNQLSMNEDLKTHMHRTHLLEVMHEEHKEEIEKGKKERVKISNDISELKKPVEARKYILNVVKGVSAIAALYLIFTKIL